MGRVIAWISKALDVRPAELQRVVPLTVAYALILATLYLLKPARNALFLHRLGVDQLPWVMLLVAAAGAAAAWLFARVSRRSRVDRLVLGSFVLVLLFLVAFRLLLPTEWAWVYYAFYVWVNLYGLIVTSLIWLLAGAVFNAREARRLFGLVGTGGIAGAIGGGLLTGLISPVIGTENLLLVAAGLVFVCFLLIRQVEPHDLQVRKKAKQRGDESVIGLIASTPLLRSLAGMAAFLAVVAAIVDIQFNAIVNEIYVDTDQKTSFFGHFFAYLSAFALLFQFVATPRILQRFDVIAGLLFLPVGLALGSGAVLFVPGLLAAILVKGSDGGFRFSIHKSATEILYVPISAEAKKRTKVFIDASVDTLATGVGALLVLALTGPLGLDHRQLGYVSIVLVAGWLLLVFSTRRAYVDAFRKALERRELDLADVTVKIADPATIRPLIAALGSDNVRQLIYALDLLGSVRSMKLEEPVLPLLDHPSPEVRSRALRVLTQQSGPHLLNRMDEQLDAPDLAVVTEAVRFVRAHGPEGRLLAFLEQDDPKLVTAALVVIAEEGTAEEQALLSRERVEQIMRVTKEDEHLRARVAYAIGTLESPALEPLLAELCEDRSEDVVVAVIEAMGGRNPEHIPWLVEKLADRRFRRDARRSLAQFGDRALDALERQMRQGSSRSVRRNAVRALGEVGSQRAADLLLEHLSQTPSALRTEVAQALGRMRHRFPELRFSRRRVAQALEQETDAHRLLGEVSGALVGNGEGPARDLLRRAVVERRQEILERIFKLLSLRYDPEDIDRAFYGVTSTSEAMRASALEFLDNLLSKELSHSVMRVLEADREDRESDDQAAGQAIERLIKGEDAWLKAVALFDAKDGAIELEPLLEAAERDPDPLVAEVAASIRSDTHSQRPPEGAAAGRG